MHIVGSVGTNKSDSTVLEESKSLMALEHLMTLMVVTNRRLLSTSWSLLLAIESQSSVPGYTIESHMTPLLVILQSLSISQ